MRILALILTAMLCLTGCVGQTTDPNSDQDEDVYKIGIYQPLTGDDADGAQAELWGIELAHMLNPTVAGKKVELVYADTKSDSFGGKLAAQKLVNNRVDIILGSYGNVMSMTGGRYFAEGKIPAIAITCSNPLVTKGNPYYFRIGTVDSYQAPVAASYVFNELKSREIAILKVAKDDYGTALAQSFSEKLEELDESLEVISLDVSIDLGNLNQQLEKLKQAKAKVIYLPCGNESALAIMAAAAEIGYRPQFVGTYLWHDQAFLEKGGDLLEGIVFTDYLDGASAINDKATEFLANYKKQYGEDLPQLGAALGYDAYMLAISALEAQAQENGEVSLQELLAKTSGFEGVTGRITFNEDGDPIKPMRISTVENGEFKEKHIAKPEEDPEENSGEGSEIILKKEN